MSEAFIVDAVEDVIFGCVDNLAPQAADIARTCWLAAGVPEHVPGVTIDRQCGSSQQAIHFAAESHRRAMRACAEGRFEGEIAPIAGVISDEGPREPDYHNMRSLPPLREGGKLTAAVASQISPSTSSGPDGTRSGSRARRPETKCRRRPDRGHRRMPSRDARPESRWGSARPLT
jgi:acetyl-CoA acetyltransferase